MILRQHVARLIGALQHILRPPSSLKGISFLTLLITSFSCNQEDTPAVLNNRVSFTIVKTSNEGGRISLDEIPATVFLSINDKKGNVIYANKKIVLLEFGHGYVSESLEMPLGDYALIKFMVLNSSDKIVYATPVEGSEKAKYVEDPLVINFTVSKNTSTEVKPQVLTVSSYDTPESFGYSSFGFEVVDADMIKALFKIELKIGQIIYQDVDADIFITAYDAANQEQWEKQFSYVGPIENEYSIKAGFHHYTIELKKWGIVDQQTMTGQHLWNGRADGAEPVTYVLGGAIAARKLVHYTNYMEKADPANRENIYMAPQYDVEYTYNGQGKVEKITFASYSVESNTFEPERFFEFSYIDDRVDKISGYHVENEHLYIEDFYHYLPNGNVSRIIEKNYGDNSTSEVNLSYNYADRYVNAAYTHSNGYGFQYEFLYHWKNIVTDKTSRWGQLCSEGAYTYDKNINPLKHLGYVDFLLQNYSINNKLTEGVQYKACAFPELIPESYQHEYDSQGYPTVSTTFYKSNTETRKGQNRYYYQ